MFSKVLNNKRESKMVKRNKVKESRRV